MNNKKEDSLVERPASPLELAASLVQKDGNMDVAKLKELLDVQQRWEAIQAKKAYAEAMAKFKENPPEILNDKEADFPTQKGPVKYTYATLHNITTQINKELSKYGLNAFWVPRQDNGLITITCKITHIAGHSEEASMSGPPDLTGSKNAIQAIGSTTKYLEKYTMLALTGLSTFDECDDDGKSAAPPPTKNNKPKPFEKTKEIMEQAFFNLTTEYKDDLPEGYVFSFKKFENAVKKHFKRLPTRKESIEKIVNTVKVDEIIEEMQPELI